MRARLLPALVIAMLALPAGAYPPVPKAKDKKADPKEVAKAVEGTWEVTKMERGGAAGAVKISYTMTLTIKGKQLTQTLNLQGRELKSPDSTITLDTTKTPPTFDVQSVPLGARPTTVRMKGVLKVDGDTMTWTYVTLKGDRPKKVEGELEDGQMRYTFKRVKK